LVCAPEKRTPTLFTLETSDYVEAVQKAAAIISRPKLNPTQGLKADIDTFVQYQLAHHNWTKASAQSKQTVLIVRTDPWTGPLYLRD